MVGINFKKKIINIVHLESYTSYKEYLETHKIKVPIDSFICYSIYKFCNSNFVTVRFIPIRTEPENQKPSVTLVEGEGEKFIFLLNEYEIPWTVALCEYPVIMAEDVIITGLCAVTRQICMFWNSFGLRQVHEDGLLGFRHTCLQAPNEVSVWTKFCEIEIIRAVQELLTANDIKEVPEALVRFEDHMRQPVRIHNVYKVARNLKKESLNADKEANAEHLENTEPDAKVEQHKNEPGVNTEQYIDAQKQINAEHESAAQTEQRVKSKHETNGEELENAGETQEKVKPKHKTHVEQQENGGQTEEKLKSKCKHETNVKQHENAEEADQTAEHHKHTEQQEKAVQTEQIVKSKHKHQKNLEQEATADEQDSKESREDSSSSKRTSKARKWKSHKNKDISIDCSTKVEDLDVNHEFAEGPYLTLADLVLLPSYNVIIQSIGETQFRSLLPFTYKWYKNLVSIDKIQETFMSLMSHFNLKQLPSDMTIPTADDVSLYKCDPKRHNPKRKIYTNSDDIEKALSSLAEGLELPMCENEYQPTFKWKDIPEPANPFAGYLPDSRVQRKSEQLQNLALPVLNMATDGDVIVDFCCGTGHLGILLAYLLPRCTIILLENKVESLGRARERVKKMRLTNVYYYQCNLDFFIGEFDIGIGLHACGIATDLILDKCLKQNARFVISPCCYGAIHGTCRMEYPRSKKFASVPFDDYLYIAHGADQTHTEHPLAVRGARCMTVIDSDRARLAEEFGYKVTLMTLKPVTCTPKNNLLIGISTEK